MAEEVPGEVGDANSLNPESLGFMCGLEIHQQLATGKLHSREASTLYDHGIDEIQAMWNSAHRRLRAARGESGQIDVAARFEQRRNRSFVYYQSPNSGLIELDEAPPLKHDQDAVNVALTISAMMNAKPVGALQAMRKTVVDGSNTSGFQRTTLVATHGSISTPTGSVGIDVICLEEDSARKLDTKSVSDGEQVFYTLDRLGIPLVEIATAPDETISPISVISFPSCPNVIAPIGKILIGKDLDLSITYLIFSGVSNVGLVLGITQTLVYPPENAAFDPVSRVSLSSLPGSRK